MFQWLLEQYGMQLDPIFISAFSIFLVTLLYTLIRPRTNKLNLPPSPSKLPIIGNLHQLGTLPHRSLQSLARKHGPLMLLHLGQTPALIVSSDDAAKEVIQIQDFNFCNRPRMSFAERLLYSSKDLAFSPYGEYWKQMRKISTQHLLSGHRVESFRTVREEEANIMIDKIHEYCSSASSVVNLSELIYSFTNNVVCRVAMGRKFDAGEGAKKFSELITEFMNLIGVFNVADYIPWLSIINNFNGLNARVRKSSKEMDCFLESVIQDHIDPKKKTNSGVEDFIDVLLGMQNDSTNRVSFARDNIKAVILDMFAAGTDTSAVTLVWAMTELIKHPEIMKEVQAEIREISKGKLHITEDDLGQMHYLKMVIKEALRLHSPASIFVPHESIQDTKLLGYDIPAKTRIFINQWAIANDPMLWDEPEEFRPKRFLNTSIDYQGKDFKFFPFGAGRRGLFATPNMELPLANLLYHFNWSLPNGLKSKDVDVAEEFGIILHKKSPLLLVPTPCGF
ncbi:hypothetical protein AQUCO_01200067v1 [Aquilegia coerulea]|uniref:Cytochrome P450 n=1 Tax=Aquilegia coerulea TaxID=218851 RepID=A0A2G5E4C4_AQUCA|nr:hypothetical protein AQUCO_01200067v1 [Aquilegia coerulea]